MSLTRIPLNKAYLRLYIEGNKAVLFNQHHRSLYQLPPLSVALLLALDEGMGEQDCIDEIATQSGLSRDNIIGSYKQIETLFNEKTLSSLSYLDGRYPELAIAKGKIHIELSEHRLSYEVAGSHFAICTDYPALAREIADLLKPCQTQTSEPDFVIQIHSQRDKWQIAVNELVVESELNYNEIMPLLIDRLQILAFQSSDYWYCFHGAALHTAKGILLLPGKSGAGKSTLSALLCDEHTQLFSDEIIALNKDFQPCLLPLPMAIKSGSWALLEEKFPALKHAPIWLRLDGRQLKYIWPKRCAEGISHGRYMLVNPCFTGSVQGTKTNKEASIIKLGIIDSLTLLTEAGYQLGVELSVAKLEHLINFLEKIDCYHLSYTHSEAARQQLDSLWHST